MSTLDPYGTFLASTDSELLGVVPVAAVAEAEHETIVFWSLIRYSSHFVVPFDILLRPGHPELERRADGTHWQPNIGIHVMDDLGTEYKTFPGGEGGSGTRRDFSFHVLPAIPENAARLTIQFAELEWVRPDQGIWILGADHRTMRWQIQVDLANQVTPTSMEEIS